MMSTKAKRVWLIVLLTVAAPTIVQSQRADVVQVSNGDRITGTVSGLDRGELSFRTAAAGTVSIAWTQVVTLTSTEILDVEVSSGERYSGTISSPADRQLIVQTASGPTPSIDMKSVIRMTPISASVRARTTGSVDFGASITTANDSKTYTLDAAVANRTRSYETEMTFASWLQKQDAAEALTRNDLELDVRRLLPRRWFAVAKVAVQEDGELDLDWRVVAGGGIGRKLIQSTRMRLAVEGGLDYDSERYGHGVGTDRSAELFAGVDWDYFARTWATDSSVAATTFISLERQRARLELDAQLRRDMFWNMYWSVNVFESFDSDPPGDGERSNLGVSFTLGWSF